MKPMLHLAVVLAVVAAIVPAAPSSAAGNQPYFQGFWRCQGGVTRNITPGFGPWLSYRTTQGSQIKQSYVYHDNAGGGWVSVGVDSQGGYWTMTSTGWQNKVMTFNGNYSNYGRSQTQREVITWNSDRAMTVQLFRSGTMVGQTGCNK